MLFLKVTLSMSNLMTDRMMGWDVKKIEILRINRQEFMKEREDSEGMNICGLVDMLGGSFVASWV